MKLKLYLIGASFILLAGVSVSSFLVIRMNNRPAVVQPQTVLPSTDKNDTTIRFTAEPGKTILDQLTAIEAVETKQSTDGIYVDSIGGKKGGDDGKFWTCYVDGQPARLGPAAYITVGGETIEWKFE